MHNLHKKILYFPESGNKFSAFSLGEKHELQNSVKYDKEKFKTGNLWLDKSKEQLDEFYKNQ